jgi:hypothetical protein
MAEPAPELPVDPDPLAHGDLPGKLNVTVAPFRMQGKCLFCLPEEHGDTLAGDLFCSGFFRSWFHTL